MQRLAKKQNTTSAIITGHSLGAATASLLAFDISLLIRSGVVNELGDVNLVTFGSPRVGNHHFVEAFKGLAQKGGIITSHRVVHADDIVPHAPFVNRVFPFEILGGFEHLPNEVFYNEPSSHYRVCNDSVTEDEHCSAGESIEELSISDHLRYLNVSMGISGC